MSSSVNLAPKRFTAATLYEAAGRRGALPREIGILNDRDRVWGPARTVDSAPGDNIWIHRAIEHAQRGDIIVVTTGGMIDAGYWGELMTRAAMRAGVAGLVIDGCVRDVSRIKELGFPILCRGACLEGTTKMPAAVGSTGQPIKLGDTTIIPGDLVVGDCDGAVVVRQSDTPDVLWNAEQREKAESVILQRLTDDGTSLLDLLAESLVMKPEQ
jgi:4-hydroxy-4-methyl-2-oxoglutarate aldolase